MKDLVKSILEESRDLKQRLAEQEEIHDQVQRIVLELVKAFRSGRKVLFCGNGGSAADAQHLACELSGRYYLDRKALFAEALHVNTSFLTAVGNDFGFEDVFARALEAMGAEGDVLVALSTSGRSPNVIKAIQKAKTLGMKVVGLTGLNGGQMVGICDHLIRVPSEDTARIQEGHMLLGHIICQLTERALFSAESSPDQ